jgi:hypothetical protein
LLLENAQGVQRTPEFIDAGCRRCFRVLFCTLLRKKPLLNCLRPLCCCSIFSRWRRNRTASLQTLAYFGYPQGEAWLSRGRIGPAHAGKVSGVSFFVAF